MKGEVGKQSATFQQELDSLMREQQMDQDILDNEKRRRNEFSSKITQKQHELEVTKKRVERLAEQIE